MLVAVPVLCIGLSLSPVGPNPESGYLMEGQNLLYLLLKYMVLGPIPEGHDVHLHPTAAAGWAGLLLTMLNLIPFGQLDGGHIAYALLGDRHTTLSRYVHWALLALFAGSVLWFIAPVFMDSSEQPVSMAISNSMHWLVWFGLLALMKKLQGGYQHPPTDDSVLSPGRRWVAWGTLLLFVTLFMPTPLTQH
jgi:membrane-associated protease RseP (regulator of RpoE activity)